MGGCRRRSWPTAPWRRTSPHVDQAARHVCRPRSKSRKEKEAQGLTGREDSTHPCRLEGGEALHAIPTCRALTKRIGRMRFKPLGRGTAWAPCERSETRCRSGHKTLAWVSQTRTGHRRHDVHARPAWALWLRCSVEVVGGAIGPHGLRPLQRHHPEPQSRDSPVPTDIGQVFRSPG